jgi:predicted DNA-binding transcriptional regulator AlpA
MSEAETSSVGGKLLPVSPGRVACDGREGAVTEDANHLLTMIEVASFLRVSAAWVRDHASGRRRPVLPSVKLGRSVRFRRFDVCRFIEECARNAG